MSLSSVAGRVIELVFGVRHMCYMCVCVCVRAGPSWTTVWQTFRFLVLCWQEQAFSSPRGTGRMSETAAHKTPNSVTHISAATSTKNLIPRSKRQGTKPLTNADFRKKEYKKTLRHLTVKLSRRSIFKSREADVHFGFSKTCLCVQVNHCLYVSACGSVVV